MERKGALPWCVTTTPRASAIEDVVDLSRSSPHQKEKRKERKYAFLFFCFSKKIRQQAGRQTTKQADRHTHPCMMHTKEEMVGRERGRHRTRGRERLRGRRQTTVNTARSFERVGGV